jgi:hypothetical protein
VATFGFYHFTENDSRSYDHHNKMCATHSHYEKLLKTSHAMCTEAWVTIRYEKGRGLQILWCILLVFLLYMPGFDVSNACYT